MHIRQIICFYSAKGDVDMSALGEIYLHARETHASLGITGQMVYVAGYFLQFIEGPAVSIDTLLKELSAEVGETHLTILVDRPWGQRLFSDWTMGFFSKSADGSLPEEGLNPIDSWSDLPKPALTGDQSSILNIMRSIYNANAQKGVSKLGRLAIR